MVRVRTSSPHLRPLPLWVRARRYPTLTALDSRAPARERAPRRPGTSSSPWNAAPVPPGARAAKRSPLSAVRTAVDFVDEGAIDRETALLRVAPDQLDSVLAPLLTRTTRFGSAGVSAQHGRGVCGRRPVWSSTTPTRRRSPTATLSSRGRPRPGTCLGMIAARAVSSPSSGDRAAVVTRALGRPSVVGVGDDVTSGAGWRASGQADAKVIAGRLPTEDVPVEDIPGLEHLLAWARQVNQPKWLTDLRGAVDLNVLRHQVRKRGRYRSSAPTLRAPRRSTA